VIFNFADALFSTQTGAMAKVKTNFTYIIGLDGGAEEGPLTLADLKPRLREGKIVGSTFIKRSDRMEWSTAADLPELNVKDVVEGKDPWAPDALTVEMEKERYMRKVRAGVSWLFWIGGLSLVNSALAAAGVGRSYAMGLGVAHLIAALGEFFGASGIWISLSANIGLSLAYIACGFLAWQGRPWLLGPAVVIYVADTILCGLFDLWLSVGLHGLALFYLVPGFLASFDVRKVEITNRTWITHGVATAILSAAGFAGFMFLEKAGIPEPAKWAATSPAQWPQISVANAAEFKGHTHLKAGNAFLIRTRNGKILAGTARHLLGSAGGVEPTVKLSEFDSALKEWTLTTRTTPPKSARISKLHGLPGNYGALKDWVLFEVHPEDVANLPAEPLSPRLALVEQGATVYLVGAGLSGTKQEVHRATVLEADDWSINAKLDKPIDLFGFSGSPVVDADGNLIGVLTSSRAQADKEGKMTSFVAESVLEMKNLLR
jgi:hypothetical protein